MDTRSNVNMLLFAPFKSNTGGLAGFFSLCRGGGLVGDFVQVSTWSFITWAAVREDHWFAHTAVWHWPEASDHWPGSAGLIIYPMAYCLHCTRRISSLPVLVESSLCLPSCVSPQKDGWDGWWCLLCWHFYISDFITHKILHVAFWLLSPILYFVTFKCIWMNAIITVGCYAAIFLWEQNMWEKKKHVLSQKIMNILWTGSNNSQLYSQTNVFKNFVAS